MAKALLPIWRRNSETSREMDYGEIKAYINFKYQFIQVLRSYIMSNQQIINYLLAVSYNFNDYPREGYEQVAIGVGLK